MAMMLNDDQHELTKDFWSALANTRTVMLAAPDHPASQPAR